MANKITKELLSVNDIRFNNKVNILTHIVKEQGGVTRSHLAQQNQISVMTVKHIVDELIRDGMIEEHTSQAYLGRKPKALYLSPQYGNIVCINLTSVDEITYIIYDLKETILTRAGLKLQHPKNYQDSLLKVIANIKAGLQQVDTQTVGVAVFVPSAYYEEQDQVNYDLIPDFKDLKIKHLFQSEFGISNVLILHDAYAAARSEYEGADPLCDSQFYFYCGSGVGGFFFDRGRAVTGRNLVAGEVGKMIIKREQGRAVTLEEIAAIPGILKRINECCGAIEAEEIFARYEQGDPVVAGILDDILEDIAQVLHNLIWIYNPTKVVVDSCYEEYSRLIMEKASAFFEQHQDRSIPIDVSVCQARYDEYHMMRGCYKLALEKWIEEMVWISQNREG